MLYHHDKDHPRLRRSEPNKVFHSIKARIHILHSTKKSQPWAITPIFHCQKDELDLVSPTHEVRPSVSIQTSCVQFGTSMGQKPVFLYRSCQPSASTIVESIHSSEFSSMVRQPPLKFLNFISNSSQRYQYSSPQSFTNFIHITLSHSFYKYYIRNSMKNQIYK